MSASIDSAKNPGTPKAIPGVVTAPKATGPHVAIPGAATQDKEQGLAMIPGAGTCPNYAGGSGEKGSGRKEY